MLFPICFHAIRQHPQWQLPSRFQPNIPLFERSSAIIREFPGSVRVKEKQSGCPRGLEERSDVQHRRGPSPIVRHCGFCVRGPTAARSAVFVTLGRPRSVRAHARIPHALPSRCVVPDSPTCWPRTGDRLRPPDSRRVSSAQAREGGTFSTCPFRDTSRCARPPCAPCPAVYTGSRGDQSWGRGETSWPQEPADRRG